MINTKQQFKNNQKQTIMKKKIIGAMILCALAIIATIGINLNTHSQNSRLDLMLENVEAAACSLLETDSNGKQIWCNCKDKTKVCGTKRYMTIYGEKETRN